MSRLVVDQVLHEQLRAHALRDYPDECCGALFGYSDTDSRIVVSLLEIDNATGEDRRRRFAVSPRDYLRAEREADRRGLTLLGFYHSHPDHPATPSEIDRKFAQIGFSYPIISVYKGEIRELASWCITKPDAWYVSEEVVLSERNTGDRIVTVF